MKKSSLFLALGFVTLVVSFLYELFLVGLPYQDAPQYLIERQAFHLAISSYIFWLGIFLFLIGVFFLFLDKRNNKKRIDIPSKKFT